MQKNRPLLDVAQSNMALVGSDLRKKIRPEDAAKNPQWMEAGTEEGILVWRVENTAGNFGVKLVTKFDGLLFDGDSYLILHTIAPCTDSATLGQQIIYMVLGKYTTQDEYCVAAIKMVELDSLLGGGPIQRRVVQGAEPGDFLELIPNLRWAEGGVASGFTQAEKVKLPTRLMMVRGSGLGIINSKLYSVKPVIALLNEDDTFVLDTELESGQNLLYVFHGKTSSAGEKNVANSYAAKIAAMRQNGAKTCVVDTDHAPLQFWSALGHTGTTVPVIRSSVDKNHFVESRKVAVYRVCGDGGKAAFKKEVEGDIGKLQLSVLESNDVFVVDAGAEVFIWQGKGCSDVERTSGFVMGQSLLNTQTNPAREATLTTIAEGREPAFFLSLFESATAAKK